MCEIIIYWTGLFGEHDSTVYHFVEISVLKSSISYAGFDPSGRFIVGPT